MLQNFISLVNKQQPKLQVNCCAAEIIINKTNSRDIFSLTIGVMKESFTLFDYRFWIVRKVKTIITAETFVPKC